MATSKAGASATAQRNAVEKRLSSLKQQRQQIEGALASNPPNAAALNLQLQGVMSGQSDIQGQLQSLPSADDVFSLSVLQPATPIEINARGYNSRRTQNLNARSQLPQAPDSKAPYFDETDLSSASPTSKPTRIALGGAAGLVLGLISAFVIEAWDDRVRRRERVEDLTGLGVLAEIPHFGRDEARNHEVAVQDEPTSAAGERYRAARTAISFALDETSGGGDTGGGAKRATPVLMVTSPGPGEGKTTTAANLAAAFADSGQRVLVVDGDFRRPAMRRFLAPVPNLVAPDVPCETRIEGVQFLAGPHDASNPDAAVASLRDAIDVQRSAYDMVILDTPPILTTNDAVDLLSAADAVVLVLRADKTRAKATRLVAELLRRFQADALGVVLNSCDRTEMNEYYGYGYGYSYGYLGKSGSKRGKGTNGQRNVNRRNSAESPPKQNDRDDDGFTDYEPVTDSDGGDQVGHAAPAGYEP